MSCPGFPYAFLNPSFGLLAKLQTLLKCVFAYVLRTHGAHYGLIKPILDLFELKSWLSRYSLDQNVPITFVFNSNSSCSLV